MKKTQICARYNCKQTTAKTKEKQRHSELALRRGEVEARRRGLRTANKCAKERESETWSREKPPTMSAVYK